MINRVPRERGRSWPFREGYRIGSNRYSKLRDDPLAWHLRPTGTKTRCSTVSPSEGNEARRKDCQEVGASHNTAEPGELARRTLGREGDAIL
jgi:hypothetical protein